MISDPSDAAIDQIVASCNGDLRGALKAQISCQTAQTTSWPWAGPTPGWAPWDAWLRCQICSTSS